MEIEQAYYLEMFEREQAQAENLKLFFAMQEQEQENEQEQGLSINEFFIFSDGVKHNRNLLIVDSRNTAIEDNRRNNQDRSLKFIGLTKGEHNLLNRIKKRC